jgi:putative two-component system response regulator
MDPQAEKQIILVVDDAPENTQLLGRLLAKDYRVNVAMNGETALQIAESEEPPDLILLDVRMPGMNGYEVCQHLKAGRTTQRIPVIFLTGMSDVEAETKGFEVGGSDYVAKPFNVEVINARIKTHLALYALNQSLEEKVRQRTREIAETQEVTILSLATLAEYRNQELGRHALRTKHYIRLLAEHLKNHDRFRDFLDPETIATISKSAPLHDIGKVGVPDNVLLKMDKLKPLEEEELKKHTVYGKEAIARAEKALKSAGQNSFLHIAKEIAYTHHENWDGSGYPQGLTGKDIPLAGRLMAVADAYDMLVSKRLDKPPYPHQTAMMIIANDKGKKYDPDIVDAFMKLQGEFHKIARELADFEEEREILAKQGVVKEEPS